MSFIRQNKIEKRLQALRKVVRFCGGVQAYSDLLELERSRVSNWVNQDVNPPYEYMIITEDFSKISLDDLSPFTEKANAVIKRLRINNRLLPVELFVNNILFENFNGIHLRNNYPIIVDSRGVLIAGLEQLRAHKALGKNKILAIVLDLDGIQM